MENLIILYNDLKGKHVAAAATKDQKEYQRQLWSHDL